MYTYRGNLPFRGGVFRVFQQSKITGWTGIGVDEVVPNTVFQTGNEIFDQRGSTFWKWKLWERERRGEREKNRWTAISFFSLVLFEIELVDADASRLATCREFWCIYRVNIEIFPSRRRRYRAETLIFQRSIEQRREKASIAHPPLAANLSRTRNFSFSFLDRMLHIRPTSYHAFICIYLLFR